MTRRTGRFSVESTAYLTADSTGQGLGSSLNAELIRLVQQSDVHAVVSGISLPNALKCATLRNPSFS